MKSGPVRVWACALALLALAGCALAPAPAPIVAPAQVEQLAQALAREPVVLLGEVHDNAYQHALRAQALRRLLAGGARPAIAFEQFDREYQERIDKARAQGGDVAQRAQRIVALGSRGWNWIYYRPYVELALKYDLPIVAANLSRAQAMRVAQDGAAAVFDAPQRTALGLDRIGASVQAAQERAIAQGHCGRLPAEAVAPIATAQIARDAVLAQSLAPYVARGVVLLTGNGHARRDIGVAQHLEPAVRARTMAIGLVEDDDQVAEHSAGFDIVVRTPAQARVDPCASF